MAKTFYSVTFAVWGSDFCRAAWFDGRAAADDWRQECADRAALLRDLIAILEEG